MKLLTSLFAGFLVLSLIPATLITSAATKADSLPSNFIFSTGFEKKDNIGWNKEVCNPCSHAINIVDSHSRSGLYSARFELHKSDPNSSSGSKRAELARKNKELGTKRERWYGVSIFLPNSYDYDPEAEIVTQWHATPDKNTKGRIENWRSPPLALLTVKGEWQIDWRWDKNEITHKKPEKSHKKLGTYAKGKWTDWTFHVIWSYADKGQLEVWKNGKKVLSYSGPIGYNDRQGVYMKVGLYKWAWKDNRKSESTTTHRVIYIDDIYSSTVNLNYKVQ